jgi:hypothetical protein
MIDSKSRAAARGRVPAGPLCAALAIAVGITLVWAVVAVWSNQALTRPSAYIETMNVTSDGTPLISRYYAGTLQRSENFTLDRKPYTTHEPPTISGAQVADSLAALAPRATAKRPREEPIVLSYSDARPRLTSWYFVVFGNPAGNGYFVGYDVLTRDRVGYIAREGFQLDLPAEGRFITVRRTNSFPAYSFIAPANNHNQGEAAYWYANATTTRGAIPAWICHVVSGGRLLRIDLRERNVRTVLETPGLFSVSVAQRPRPDTAAQGNSQPEQEDCLVVRSPDTLTVLDSQDRVEKTYRLPAELKNTGFTFYPTANGKAVATFFDRARYSSNSYNVVEFAADGKVSHSASQVTDAGFERSKEAEAAGLSFAFPEPIVPVVTTLIAPWNAEVDNPSAGSASVVAEFAGYIWPMYLVTGIFGIVSVALYSRHAARAGNPPSIAWMLFVFLFAIPGFLGYLWHRRWPVRLACPACGTHAPRDRDNCARCGTLFPAPAPDGLEIFA